MRIDKYNSGAIMGQQISKIIETDKEGFLKGETREEALALVKEAILTQSYILKKLAEDPIIGPMMDAQLKY